MSFVIANIELKEKSISFDKYFIAYDKDLYQIVQNEKYFILIEGFLFNTTTEKQLTETEIAQQLLNLSNQKSVFPENITGQYNIVFINENKILLINDFVGMKPLYYHLDDKVFISNNIYRFFDFGFQIDQVGVLQSFVGQLFIPLNNRTLVKNVNRLLPGEYVAWDIKSQSIECVIDSIDIQNKKISKVEVEKIITEIKKNAKIYSRVYKNITLPISGGVDSRITLTTFYDSYENINLISYGESDYIDNKIAKKIATRAGISHENISFKSQMFQTRKQFDEMLLNGGEYISSAWFSVKENLKQNIKYDNSVVLIGDVLDILRAKNIKSFRTRKKRIKYQINQFFGRKNYESQLDLKKMISTQLQKYRGAVENLCSKYPYLLKKLDISLDVFINETERDLEKYVAFLQEKVNPKNQLNLEEAFFIFTWGVKTMGKQILVFKGEFPSYVLMASRHLVKFLLQYYPLDRFEDKLTHKMLKNPNFNYFSNIPTSQVPFVPYKANIYLKYIFWAYRSLYDQISIKLNRGRLFKHIEWKQYYLNPKNKTLLEELLKDTDSELSIIPMEKFNKRASGEIWPLSEVDINAYTYLLKFLSLQKQS